MAKLALLVVGLALGGATIGGCDRAADTSDAAKVTAAKAATADYFLLRPKLEKEYGYSHAVKIGDPQSIGGRERCHLAPPVTMATLHSSC